MNKTYAVGSRRASVGPHKGGYCIHFVSTGGAPTVFSPKVYPTQDAAAMALDKYAEDRGFPAIEPDYDHTVVFRDVALYKQIRTGVRIS